MKNVSVNHNPSLSAESSISGQNENVYSTNHALDVNIAGGGGVTIGTVNQGTPAAIGDAWPIKITDGTNTAGVVDGDPGFDGLAVAAATKTMTFSTSIPGAQTILANTNVEGYSWIEIVYTSVGSGLALTGQFSTASDGTYVNSNTFGNGGAAVANLGTTVNTIYDGPIRGNYFQIAVSALSSGTFAGTVTLRNGPTPFTVFGSVQSGTWSIGSNSATGATVPANAFYIGLNGGTSTLTGAVSGVNVGDSSNASAVLGTTNSVFNGASWDRQRANSSGVVIAAGATTTQSNIALTTYNANKLALLVSITSGAGSLVVNIKGASSSGYTYAILDSASLSGTSVTPLRVFPGATPSANAVANDMVPRNIQVTVTVTGSVTYGVDYILGV